MTPYDALVQAIGEAAMFRYDRAEATQVSAGLPVPWELPDDVAHTHDAICSGFVMWALARAWTLAREDVHGGFADDVHAELYFIAGKRDGAYHAWIALASGPDFADAWWADPTPPNCIVERPSYFAGREPIEWLRWAGKGFDKHGAFV